MCFGANAQFFIDPKIGRRVPPLIPPLQLTISVYQSALGTTLRGVAKVTRKTVSVASMNLELQRKIAMPLKQYGPEKLLVLPLLRFQ